VDPQDLGEEDGANVDLDSQRKGKCAVIKTSTRQVCSLFGVHSDYIALASLIFTDEPIYLLCCRHISFL